MDSTSVHEAVDGDVEYDSSVASFLRLHADGWAAWYTNVALDGTFFGRCGEVFGDRLSDDVCDTQSRQLLDLWAKLQSSTYESVLRPSSDALSDVERELVAQNAVQFGGYTNRIRLDVASAQGKGAYAAFMAVFYADLLTVEGFTELRVARSKLTLANTIFSLWRLTHNNIDMVQKLVAYVLLRVPVDCDDAVRSTYAFVGRQLTSYWSRAYEQVCVTDAKHTSAHVYAMTGDASAMASAEINPGELWCFDGGDALPVESALRCFIGDCTSASFNCFYLAAVRMQLGVEYDRVDDVGGDGDVGDDGGDGVVDGGSDSGHGGDAELARLVRSESSARYNGVVPISSGDPADGRTLAVLGRVRVIESVMSEVLCSGTVTLTPALVELYGSKGGELVVDSVLEIDGGVLGALRRLGDVCGRGIVGWLKQYVDTVLSPENRRRARAIELFQTRYGCMVIGDGFRECHVPLVASAVWDDYDRSLARRVFIDGDRYCASSAWFSSWSRANVGSVRVLFPGAFVSSSTMLAYLSYAGRTSIDELVAMNTMMAHRIGAVAGQRVKTSVGVSTKAAHDSETEAEDGATGGDGDVPVVRVKKTRAKAKKTAVPVVPVAPVNEHEMSSSSTASSYVSAASTTTTTAAVTAVVAKKTKRTKKRAASPAAGTSTGGDTDVAAKPVKRARRKRVPLSKNVEKSNIDHFSVILILLPSVLLRVNKSRFK